MNVDRSHPGEMREDHRIAVELQIVTRPVAFVAAHHRREGRHLAPTHQQIGRAHIAEQAGVAADVGVVKRVAEQARRQGGADHRDQPVMPGKIDRLVARPEPGAMLLRPRETGPHEEHGLAGAASARHRLRIHFGPEHRPVIVREPCIDTAGKTHIDRQILAKIGHPA